MSSPVDFDEFDLEIQAFGEYLDDISRKINARNHTETLSDPEDEGSSEEEFETPVVNIPPISAQLDDCAINGDDINKPVEVAVDVIPKDSDRDLQNGNGKYELEDFYRNKILALIKAFQNELPIKISSNQTLIVVWFSIRLDMNCLDNPTYVGVSLIAAKFDLHNKVIDSVISFPVFP
uniref:Uncharacterized protein n=1 Tax=Timema tahoe TaxID=61484 RepID=A0A7R9NUD4_9NEOP|nr:unnamed protein product [Timema tahoe]